MCSVWIFDPDATHTHTHTQRDRHTHPHTQTYTHTPTDIHTYCHTHTQTHTHTHIHTVIHTHTHTLTHIHTHTHTHTTGVRTRIQDDQIQTACYWLSSLYVCSYILYLSSDIMSAITRIKVIVLPITSDTVDRWRHYHADVTDVSWWRMRSGWRRAVFRIHDGWRQAKTWNHSSEAPPCTCKHARTHARTHAHTV